MTDINKHKFFLVSVLRDIYSDTELANSLGFKGGTAQMLFHDLPRFSVDLDFNLLTVERSNSIYEKIRKILLSYGTIRDEAQKHFGLLLVLDYEADERNLKVEISNRLFPDSYETRIFLGIPMKVMVKPDLFAHKLCALVDRNVLTNRDIFDIYYFMRQKTPVNPVIIKHRMGLELIEYIEKCIERIEKVNPKSLLHGMGDLLDDNLKTFVKTRLKTETIQLLKMYREFPLLST